MKFLGALELFFQRGAVVLKFCKNFTFRSEIAISEIHLQHQIHETSQERLKNDIESYINLP